MEMVSSDELSVKFMDILRRHLRFLPEDQSIPPEVELKMLGLDSLKAIDLLLELENAFDIFFPDTMFTNDTFRTATTLEKAVRHLVSLREPPSH